MDKDNIFNFLTTRQAAQKKKCSERTILKWIKKDWLRGIKIGRDLLINKYDLRDFEPTQKFKTQLKNRENKND